MKVTLTIAFFYKFKLKFFVPTFLQRYEICIFEMTYT